ncbi:MAG TPA: ComEC/Rec2 family competence protein [Candidatus Limnocylindrales bacterium]|nr:ComEC/Rec2 family competence protein [Candidatus Limnocylindrales bacterium]
MTTLLRAPLLPAAVAATAVAFAYAGAVLLGAFVTTLVVVCSGALAIASVGPRRRLVWSATAIAAIAVFAHGTLPVALFPLELVTLESSRAALIRPLELLVSAPESSLLIGIVLGERSGVPAELSRAFAASGTTHLLAISGFNMTLVATAVAVALRRRVGPVTCAVASASAIVAYSLLVGLSPSVLRAALMGGVASWGVVSGRRAATANALCAAVTAMLITDPAAVNDLGLQLSALATAGLVLWQAPLTERWHAVPSPLRDGLATTIAATAPTLPVVAGAFGRVSLISPIANLVCVPLFPLLMLAGATTSALGTISLDAARPVGILAWASAFALRASVEWFASLPIAAFAVPPGAMSGAFVAIVEIAAVVIARRMRITSPPRPIRILAWPKARVASLSRRSAVAVLAIALAPAAMLVAWPGASPGTRVIALDVGQGDAYLVEVGGALALIDGGPDPARLLDELGATLLPWQRRIDVVALTHAHTDHGAGLLAVMDRYDVGLAIEPVGLNASPLTDLWAAAIAKRGVERRAVSAGQSVRLGDSRIDVLAPAGDLVVDTPSLVLRIESGAFSALFTGDAVDDALRHLLEHSERLRSRVYVPPHHGAETPFATALRARAKPEVALISVGAGNRYGHPTPQTLAALAGVPTYRTDKDGTVEISLDGTGLVVRTNANGLPPPRRGSLPYPAARQ